MTRNSPPHPSLSTPKSPASSRTTISVCCRKGSHVSFNSNHTLNNRSTCRVHTFRPARQFSISNGDDGPLPSSCVIPLLKKHEEFHQQLPIDLGGSGMDSFGYGHNCISQLKLRDNPADDGPLPSSYVIPLLKKHEEFHQQLPIDLGGSGMDSFGDGHNCISQLQLRKNPADADADGEEKDDTSQEAKERQGCEPKSPVLLHWAYDDDTTHWDIRTLSIDSQNHSEDAKGKTKVDITEAGKTTKAVQPDEQCIRLRGGGSQTKLKRLQRAATMASVRRVLELSSFSTKDSDNLIKIPNGSSGQPQATDLNVVEDDASTTPRSSTTDAVDSSDNDIGPHSDDAKEYPHHKHTSKYILQHIRWVDTKRDFTPEETHWLQIAIKTRDANGQKRLADSFMKRYMWCPLSKRLDVMREELGREKRRLCQRSRRQRKERGKVGCCLII